MKLILANMQSLSFPIVDENGNRTIIKLHRGQDAAVHNLSDELVDHLLKWEVSIGPERRKVFIKIDDEAPAAEETTEADDAKVEEIAEETIKAEDAKAEDVKQEAVTPKPAKKQESKAKAKKKK